MGSYPPNIHYNYISSATPSRTSAEFRLDSVTCCNQKPWNRLGLTEAMLQLAQPIGLEKLKAGKA